MIKKIVTLVLLVAVIYWLAVLGSYWWSEWRSPYRYGEKPQVKPEADTLPAI